jgi:hypothetical protein
MIMHAIFSIHFHTSKNVLGHALYVVAFCPSFHFISSSLLGEYEWILTDFMLDVCLCATYSEESIAIFIELEGCDVIERWTLFLIYF